VASAADADPRRPARTTLLIADTTGARPPHRLVLEGRYEPEAFSATDEQLFLIHYLSEGTGHYRVRVCDLATGTVGPLLTRAKSPVPLAAEEEMEGDGRQAVLAPDRSRLYTLYTHQGEHRHTRDLLAGRAARAGIHAFVHVLSLTEGWAFCLDLPLPFGRGPAAGHTLALDPTGQHLFVADASSGHVARASTTELTLARVAEVGGLPADPAAAARVTPDGARLLVAAGRSLLAIDTTSMAIERTWPLADAARGLALGAGGGLAFVGQADAVARVDLASGRQVGHLPAPGLETIHHVARLAR
jgi:hypothetical protein